jgi:hypothetical protein
MPANPSDFQFKGVDGRGRVQLIRDPRQSGGVAVVRIEDPEGGREGYTFDLEWRGGTDSVPGGIGRGGYGNNGRFGRNGGFGRSGGGYPSSQAINACQDAVRDRANRDYGYRDVTFRNVNADNNAGRRDSIIGTFEGRRGSNRDEFDFTCSVDFNSGRVQSVDINRAGSGFGYQGRQQGGFNGSGDAVRVCQDAVRDRLNRDGFNSADFRSGNIEDRQGRRDAVVGSVEARGGRASGRFDYSCSMDLQSGRVRSVDVIRR